MLVSQLPSYFDENSQECLSIVHGPFFSNYRYENIGVPVNEALLVDPGSVYTVLDLVLGGADILDEPADHLNTIDVGHIGLSNREIEDIVVLLHALND